MAPEQSILNEDSVQRNFGSTSELHTVSKHSSDDGIKPNHLSVLEAIALDEAQNFAPRAANRWNAFRLLVINSFEALTIGTYFPKTPIEISDAASLTGRNLRTTQMDFENIRKIKGSDPFISSHEASRITLENLLYFGLAHWVPESKFSLATSAVLELEKIWQRMQDAATEEASAIATADLYGELAALEKRSAWQNERIIALTIQLKLARYS